MRREWMLSVCLVLLVPLVEAAPRGDCRNCHTDGGAAPVLRPPLHHPVGVPYPTGFDTTTRYNRPSARGREVTFFDANGNGVPDANEIQLYGAGATIECSSCHAEHGAPGTPVTLAPHLRVPNGDSELCLVCHRN